MTALTKSCHGNTLAVGYADGSISLFNVVTGEMTVSFNGHKSAVTALNFDKQSLRLVSGSKVCKFRMNKNVSQKMVKI